MKKALLTLGIIILAIPVIYLTGPQPTFDPIDPKIALWSMGLEELDSMINAREQLVEGLRPNNEARIIWADSVRKTPYSLVYVHGFSASQMEGDPVHRTIAEKFSMNVFLMRLDGHGIDSPDALRFITPASLMESAKEAIAIGHIIGDQVVVMSCSTGGTLAIYLAAHNPTLIHSMVFYSPNIQLYDTNAKLVTGPWGMHLAKTIVGEVREIPEYFGTIFEQYTTSRYRVEGIVALQALIDMTMTPGIFSKVNQPFLLGAWYKNEEEQDKVVSVAAMRQFFAHTTTPDSLKMWVDFPEAENHVVPSGLHSKDIEGVTGTTVSFLEKVLNN